MKTCYLLPCVCGKKIEVDVNQAGLSVRCSCGAEVPVPTMRGLATLERSDPGTSPTERPSTAWGPRQGLVFLGLVIVAGASIGGLYVWYQIPEMPTINDAWVVDNHDKVGQMTLEQTWDLWQTFQTDLDARGEIPVMALHFEIERVGWRRLKMLGGVLVLGLLVAGGGLCVKSPKQALGDRR